MVDEIHVKQIIGKALYESMAPKEYTTKDTIRLHFMLYIYIHVSLKKYEQYLSHLYFATNCVFMIILLVTFMIQINRKKSLPGKFNQRKDFSELNELSNKLFLDKKMEFC